MSSALRMVKPALEKQLTKMSFGGIGDKLKKQQAAEKAAEKPAEKFVFKPTVGPLAALKNINIPGRDDPVKTPAAGTPPKPGERAPRGERLRAARRRARRTGRRSLLAASRLRRAEETGTQQRTLG